MMSIEQAAFWLKNDYLYWPGLHNDLMFDLKLFKLKPLLFVQFWSSFYVVLLSFSFYLSAQVEEASSLRPSHASIVKHSTKHNKCSEFPS